MSDTPIDYSDVQGTVLRGYRVDLARHFILKITDSAAAKRLIGSMVDGTAGMPQITTAKRWSSKPEFFVNIGFTCQGLKELGLTPGQLSTFDQGFQLGATSPETAKTVGDVGNSAPDRWIGGLSDGMSVHAILSLWVTDDPIVLEAVTARLREAFEGGMEELSSHDARALPDNRIHFGYRDNIAQPTVSGAPPRKHPIPDDQPVVKTGEFLLGYLNEYGSTYKVDPVELSTNSSYSSFRILEQDVAGFEAFLEKYAEQAKIDPETLAAKVCGRWRERESAGIDARRGGYAIAPERTQRLHLRRRRRVGRRHPRAEVSDRVAHPQKQPPERHGSRHRLHASPDREACHAVWAGFRPEEPRPGGPGAHRPFHQWEHHQSIRVPDGAVGQHLDVPEVSRGGRSRLSGQRGIQHQRG